MKDTPVGIICSDSLGRGGDMGYGMIVSRESILGARKPEELENFEIRFGEPAAQVASAIDAAERVAMVLRANKDFEVRTAEVGQILIHRPSFLMGGYIIIKTSTRSIRVEITVVSTPSPFLLETYAKLAGLLFEAVGSRLYDARTGLPFAVPPDVAGT